jgi:hypothetical protein
MTIRRAAPLCSGVNVMIIIFGAIFIGLFGEKKAIFLENDYILFVHT